MLVKSVLRESIVETPHESETCRKFCCDVCVVGRILTASQVFSEKTQASDHPSVETQASYTLFLPYACPAVSSLFHLHMSPYPVGLVAVGKSIDLLS